MAVTFDAATAAKSSVGANTTLTHTAAAGDVVAIIACAITRTGGSDIVGVSYGGISSNVFLISTLSNGNNELATFYTTNPTTGAVEVKSTWSAGSTFGMSLSVVTYSGVDMRHPIDQVVLTSGGANSSFSSLTVISTANGFAYGAIVHGDDGGTATIDSSNNERANTVGVFHHLLVGDQAGTGTHQIKWTGLNSQSWATHGFQIRPGGQSTDSS